MRLFVTATFVPPPGKTTTEVVVGPEQLTKETEHSQLGGTLRELLTTAEVGALLGMGATVVITITRHQVRTKAERERVQ